MSLHFQGKVASVSVKGHGPNSAQLLFSVRTGGPKPRSESFVALFAPGHEAQVFASMASVVISAYFAKASIGVEYKEANPTNLAIEVVVPAPKPGR